MAPDSESAKIFAVIQFLELPYRDIARYVCIPSSWITNRLPNCRAAVAYPREDANVTRKRVENNEPPAASWPAFMALIKYESDDYDDADVWIIMEEKKISADIITVDDDDDEDNDLCEALVYKSESDEDCNDETDILILKQDKLCEPENFGVPDNVNDTEHQEGPDMLLSKQDDPSEQEDIDMPNNLDDTQNQDNADIIIKSENIDIQDNNDGEGQYAMGTLIIKEDPYEEESSESGNIDMGAKWGHNSDGVENNGAYGVSEEDNSILLKSESIDIDEVNFGNDGDNAADTLTSMDEEMPKSQYDDDDDDDDDLGLSDLIILEEKKSDHTFAVDSDDNMGNSIESTVMEQHIEYSTTSLNIQTIEQSLVETNNAPTPCTTNTLQPSEIALRPTISVVPEHFLRYGCHEQKQIPENSTHIGDKTMQGVQLLTKTIYATETTTTQLIRKAQIHENAATFNVNGNYPHGEAHALSILRPNEVNHAVHAYDQNVSDNVSYPLEYTSAQHSSQQFSQPLAKSKPKKAPAKKMKPKPPTRKVRKYNHTHYHEQRGYSYITPQDTVGGIQSQNIPMNMISFDQNQLYRPNEQHLPVPVENLTLDNSTGHIIVRTTTGRNPLILNALQNSKHTVPKSAQQQHFPTTENQFSNNFVPNYAGSSRHTYPAQPGYVNQIPSHQAPQQNNPSVMGDYYNQPYSHSENTNARQFASDVGDYPVVRDPQSKLLYLRKLSEVQTYNQLPLTENNYQAVPPAMPPTSANVSSHIPDQLPVHHDTQLPTLQTQQNFQRGQIVKNQPTCDSHSKSQNNSLATQDYPHCEQEHCSQFASTATFPAADTRISTSVNEEFSGLKDINTQNNVSAIQNQSEEIQKEHNAISPINIEPTENESVVANESVPESGLTTADHQESPKQTCLSKPVCFAGDNIEKPANNSQNFANATSELDSVTAALKAFEVMLSQVEKDICKQTEAYKARHNKMFECDNEFKNIIETVISHCDSRINEVLKSKSKNRQSK
ncbi:unnamed protein product [Spodoptera littoralis]|uniref:Uncharacterized protein n=1 Tax=Spodoptera littoralis TaxID=7109 RepID=A0A9P0N1X8_SPOLI|nr:unnamed protein product [Spodoptera littoralis]CAH1639471.1 unnamed protein product [Spodoptera littoralis]